jgi:hypothetical protein
MPVLTAAVVFSSAAIAAPETPAAGPPETAGRASCEAAAYFKSAAALYGGFINSRAMEEFNNSKLCARYEETIAAGKLAQLKKAIDNSFPAAFAFEKALAFFDCPGVFYVLNSDLDSLSLLLILERDISKYEYFIKLKKNIRIEKYQNNNIYSLSSPEGIDSLYFTALNSKTYFSNEADLIKSIISKKTNIESGVKTSAPLCVYINLNRLKAKVGDIYKRNGGQYLYIYPDAAPGQIKIAAFNGEKEPLQELIDQAAGAADKINMPEDISFSAYIFKLASADFFAASLKYAEKFEMPEELKLTLKTLAASPGTGAGLVIGASGGPGLKNEGLLPGNLSTLVSFGVDKCDEKTISSLGKYLAGLKIDYKNSLLTISSAASAPAGGLQRARDFNSINKCDAAYFYYLKYDDNMAKMADNILGAALSISSWQGSNAYELMSELRGSPEVLKSLDRIFGLRLDNIKELNSVIIIKLRK